MRWLLVAILAYALLVLQTAAFHPGALTVEVGGHWARPDLVLVLGVFLALFFEPAEVFVVAWFLGLGCDLVTVAGRVGLQALAFSVLLFLLSHFKPVVPRRRIWAQFTVCLVTVLVVHAAWYMAAQAVSGAWPDVGWSVKAALVDAVYSAVLAPYVFWVLLKFRSPLGIPPERA